MTDFSVLNPLVPFDRSQLEANAPASDRVQFEGATPVSSLPFSSVTFASEATFAATTDPIFLTAPAVATATSTDSVNVTVSPAQYTGGAVYHRCSNAVVAGAAILAAAGIVRMV